MNRRAGIPSAGFPVIALVLLSPGAAFAADTPAAVPAQTPPAATTKKEQKDEELDEVLVDGTRIKVVRDPQKVLDWLARLVGKFTYEGEVDLHGRGRDEDLRTVHGMQDCIGFGIAPAVNCTINVVWPESHGPNGEEIPGGVSNLNPAMMLFGFEPDRIGIRYMLVDSKGIAEGALGLLAADSLTSRAPCVNIPGKCERIVRITAQPDGLVIEMQIDIEVDYQKAMGYRFVLHRVPGTPAVVVHGASR